jgi:hypothetical protein
MSGIESFDEGLDSADLVLVISTHMESRLPSSWTSESKLRNSAGKNCRRLWNRALDECGGNRLRGDHLLQGCSVTAK